MIVDLSRPITQWHQPFLPYAVLARSMIGGTVMRVDEERDAKYLAVMASSLGPADALVLSKRYRRILPEQVQHLAFTADIRNALDFQSRANMLNIYNNHDDPMAGLDIALKTMNTHGHYVGISWLERTREEKPRRRVVTASPLVEGQELHYLFNGRQSKDLFEKAGVSRHPITVVSDYGDACVVRVPSRSREEATVKVVKGEELHYHDVRMSSLPVASEPGNHWANVQVEMECPETTHKLKRFNKRLQEYWDDHGIAAWTAFADHKQRTDPLTVRLFPLPGKALIELDNRLRYNVFVEIDPHGFPPARPLTETERSYLLMAYMQATKESSPRRNLYEFLFRQDSTGLEEDLIKVA